MCCYPKGSKAFRYAPEKPPVTPELPGCSLFDRCEGCPYPRHGFICWHSDGTCMRTDDEKRNKRRQEEMK